MHNVVATPVRMNELEGSRPVPSSILLLYSEVESSDFFHPDEITARVNSIKITFFIIRCLERIYKLDLIVT